MRQREIAIRLSLGASRSRILTISGIYGVLAYAVARRTKEIGIRIALGESAAGVVGLILKQSMWLCAIGLGIGLTLAVALSTALASTLVDDRYVRRGRVFGRDRHRHCGVSGRGVLPRAESGGVEP